MIYVQSPQGDSRFHRLSGLVNGCPPALSEPEAVHKIHLASAAYRSPGGIKMEANRRDVPYQSLIKIWLAEKAS